MSMTAGLVERCLGASCPEGGGQMSGDLCSALGIAADIEECRAAPQQLTCSVHLSPRASIPRRAKPDATPSHTRRRRQNQHLRNPKMLSARHRLTLFSITATSLWLVYFVEK